MSDVFISYSQEDRPIAQRLVEILQEDNWAVFWDRKIEAGIEWNEELQRELRKTRCALVLWSASSRKSLWVRGEAAYAHEQDAYFPFSIDGTTPPRLFGNIQTPSLVAWVNEGDQEELSRLKSVVRSRIDPLPMYGNLEPVRDGDPVTDKHLHLVHSCWRVDKKTEHGVMPFRIHVIVYGHYTALQRIESVTYHLPGYPPGNERQKGRDREQLFELKELANGYSIIQAHVHLKSQPPGHPKVVILSRFINMTESGPRLLDEFVRRRSSSKRNETPTDDSA